jgi:hypothetical protein
MHSYSTLCILTAHCGIDVEDERGEPPFLVLDIIELKTKLRL